MHPECLKEVCIVPVEAQRIRVHVTIPAKEWLRLQAEVGAQKLACHGITKESPLEQQAKPRLCACPGRDVCDVVIGRRWVDVHTMKSSPQIWSCLRIRFLPGAMLMFVAAVACAQTVSLPEPPQVRASSQVLSLTLHAVNKNGRDAFAFNGTTSESRPDRHGDRQRTALECI